MSRRTKLIIGSAVIVALGAVAAVLLLNGDGDGDGKGTTEEKLSGSQALLFGRVTDARTSAPLAGAVITIDQEGGKLTVRTDAKGAYRSVVNVPRPIGLTIDAPGHQGAVAFGKLCVGERRELPVALPPADQAQAPPAPMVLEERCQ